MRYEPLRKKVLMELGIFIAVLAVLGGGVFYLGTVVDDYIEGNKTTQRGIDAIDAEFNGLRGKYSFIQQNAGVYEEVKRKQAANELSMNRLVVMDKFNELKAQYSLNNLRVNVSPLLEPKDPAYTRKNFSASSSDVTIDLDALSDERVYEFLDAIQQQLSGVCKITKVSLSRDKPIDEDVLSAIRKNGSYPLIKSTVKFTWYSILPVSANPTVPGIPGAPGMPGAPGFPMMPGGGLPNAPR